MTGVGGTLKKGDQTYTVQNTYEYNKDKLSKIVHNGFSYNFIYDSFGNSSDIKVGKQSLAAYQYGPNNGNLNKITYGNSDSISYTYDSYGNKIKVDVDGNPRYLWNTDNNGTVISHEDLKNQLVYYYEYDINGRLVRQDVEDTTKALGIQRNAYLLEYGYDNNNNVNRFVNKAGSRTTVNAYTFGLDDLLLSYHMPTGKNVTYTYDGINRLQQYQIGTTTPITVDYSYALSKRNDTGQTLYRTIKINTEIVGNYGTKYEYDELGNITRIYEKASTGNYVLTNSYKYDELNQLIREDDTKQNISKAYTYDLSGNIISNYEYAYTTGDLGNIINSNTYEYGDSNWKDKLTSYNGQAITYDEIGNPLNYNGYTLSWSSGRELTSLSGNGITAEYTYDADGLRTTKTVNGVKTTYEYVGGKLLYEKKGSTELHYFYDTNGLLKGIQTVDVAGAVLNYYVVTNTRGDVTQLYDEAGNVQALYTYDSWGKLLTIKDGSGNEITSDTHIGMLNSLRYRGYYYDGEIGLYYLQSRYYNPDWGRFINSDEIENTELGTFFSHNLFVYCLNNPINMVDTKGDFAISLALAAVIVTGVIIVGYYAIKVGQYISKASKKKPVNLPSIKKLTIDMPHILSGHTPNGNRNPKGKKDIFWGMFFAAIQKAIEEAYNISTKLKTQDNRVLLSGYSKTYKMVIEMWVNLSEKIIETAYPHY